jgi:eukaryotic-like serine/threonine-protein kinase
LQRTYSFDDVIVEGHAFRVLKAGKPIGLEPKAINVLVFLLENPQRLVGKRELLDQVWGDTFVTENVLSRAVAQLRNALGDDAKEPRYIETVPTRGYRFIFPISVSTATSPEVVSVVGQKTSKFARRWFQSRIVAGLTIAIIAGTVGGGLFFFRRPHTLMNKTDIILADFTNTTGDSVFDGTLRRGLSVELEQSPVLTIVSDDQIQQTLQLMGRKPDARVTGEVAKEICERLGSAAVLGGSVAQIGTEYLLTLKASKCSTGELLASTESIASDKSQILSALRKAGSEIRGKLGEPGASIRRFDTPLEQATTSSLEALKLYSSVVQGRAVSEPGELLKHAIELDPHFALAYVELSIANSNDGEAELASAFAQKAYDNRERATELERFQIDAAYYYANLGDLDRELSVYPAWEQMYPRDPRPWNDSSATRIAMGDYSGGLQEAQIALRLAPNQVSPYSNAFSALLYLNRVDEAKQIARRALGHGLDDVVHILLYRIAFAQNDTKEMAVQLAPMDTSSEGWGFELKGNTEAYFGRRRNSRAFFAKELKFARTHGLIEISALIKDADALREAEFGNPSLAKQDVATALALSSGRRARLFAALALARAGEAAKAEELIRELSRQFPSDTLLQTYWLPTIRGSIELARNNPSKALQALQYVPYELGDVGFSTNGTGNLYPVYVRGLAYLQTHQGNEAAAEFQKILDHRYLIFNSPLVALAYWGLGRARVFQADEVGARKAYEKFLTLWANADPDIRRLKQAKMEYAHLR